MPDGSVDLGESLDLARRDLDAATRTLDDHDRPFRRHGHRAEVDRAREDRRTLPARIDQLEAALAALPAEVDREQAARSRTARSMSPTARSIAGQAQSRLDRDAQTRGHLAADNPVPELVARLGPLPSDPVSRDRWITAAGRIEQHRTLATPPPGVLLGPVPPVGRADEAVTYYAAQTALADLDNSLGRQLEPVERSGRGIGL